MRKGRIGDLNKRYRIVYDEDSEDAGRVCDETGEGKFVDGEYVRETTSEVIAEMARDDPEADVTLTGMGS